MSKRIGHQTEKLEARALLAAPVFSQEEYNVTINQGYYDSMHVFGNVNAADPDNTFVGYSGTSYDVNIPTSGFYIDSMSGELRYNSYHITPGSYTFTATASDEFGGSDSTTINIIVPNSPPVFTQEIYYFSIEPGEYAYDHVFGTVSAIDSDGGFVGYSGEFRDASNNLIFYVDPMSGEIRFNSNGSTGNINVAFGSYFMTISASDEFGGSDVAEVNIIVNAPNQPPEFISDINPATELEYDGDEYHFDYDPADEGIVGYVTVEDEGDTTLTLEGEHSSLFTINEYGSIMAAGALAIGNYTFTVKTTDSAGLQDTATVFVTANHAPVFSQEVYNIEVTLQELITGGIGYVVANNILATDADADAVTYSIFTAENDPFGLLSSSSSTIIYTGQSVSTGTYSYYITAEDTHGASAYAEVNIHVIDSLNDPRTENTPPEIVLDDQDGIYEPDADGYVTITGHLVDATNYSTTYGSTYQLKLFDVDDNKLEPIDYTINEDLTFTMSIDMRGYEVGDVQLKLKATEKIMNLPPAESQVAQLTVNVVVDKPVVGIVAMSVGIESGQKIEIKFVSRDPVKNNTLVKYRVEFGQDGFANQADFVHDNDFDKLLSGEILILQGARESEIIRMTSIADNIVEGMEKINIFVNKDDAYHIIEKTARYSETDAIYYAYAVGAVVFDGYKLFVKHADDNHEIHYNDITQGYVCDCWFWAGLMAVVKENPKYISDRIKEEGERYIVKLYVRNNHETYSEKDIAVPKSDIFRTPNGGFPQGDIDQLTGQIEVWPLVLERAAAIANDTGWQAMDKDGYGMEAYRAFTGKVQPRTNNILIKRNETNDDIKKAIKDLITSGHQVLVYTKDEIKKNTYNILGNHTYLFIGFDSDNIILGDPYGNHFSGTTKLVPIGEMIEYFEAFERLK